MSTVLSTTPIHDIEILLFQPGVRHDRRIPARRREREAMLLTQGRLPMVTRQRGR